MDAVMWWWWRWGGHLDEDLRSISLWSSTACTDTPHTVFSVPVMLDEESPHLTLLCV